MKIGIKILTLVLSILALAFFLYYQNSQAIPQNIHTQQKSNKKSIHLRFGHNTPVDSALHQAALRFADEVNKRTNGKLIVDVFPAQKLGNDYQMVEMARKGELDILLTPTAKMSVAVPSMQYADLPFYFPSRQDLYDMLDGEPGQMILDDMKAIGLIGVTFWENGFKHLTANHPILSPADLEGKKIRVMKSRIIMEQFESFGAKPIAIDFYKTKQALIDKSVDGEENPLIAIVSMDFYKYQTDITLSEHGYLGYVLSFSDKSLSKLPNSLHALLIKIGKEITPWERIETQKREEKLLKVIEKEGVRVHTLTKEQREEFSKLVRHIPEQYEPIIGSNVISKTKELLYKKYGASLQNKEHILIGINADVSMGGKLAGLEIKRGVELAAREINEAGGVLSKPLEVILKDNKTLPSVGLHNIEEFAKNPNLAAIVGGKHSAVVTVELETVNQLQIPYLIPWAAASKVLDNGLKDNYVFRVSANDKIASEFIMDYTMKHYKKPAIMVENSVWGREDLKFMKKYLKELGIEFSVEIIFNKGVVNFEKELKSILDSGSESLVLVANAIEGTKIIQELAKQKKPIPVVSHWGILGSNFYKENKKVLTKIDLSVFQTFSFSKNPTQLSQKVINTYKKRYATHNAKIDFAVAQAYDITKLLAMAIEKAKSTEAKKVKKALENLDSYDGLIKRYEPAFTDKRHDALNINDFYMAKFNKDGQLVRVEEK